MRGPSAVKYPHLAGFQLRETRAPTPKDFCSKPVGFLSLFRPFSLGNRSGVEFFPLIFQLRDAMGEPSPAIANVVTEVSDCPFLRGPFRVFVSSSRLWGVKTESSRCAVDREHATGVPQQGDRWVRRRQARVHGALLQRQG
jgi:hypothetical protein